jgi:hypothetical protein
VLDGFAETAGQIGLRARALGLRHRVDAYGHALTCIDVGETPPDQRSPLSTFSEEERRLSLRELWRRFAYARSAPMPNRFQGQSSTKVLA